MKDDIKTDVESVKEIMKEYNTPKVIEVSDNKGENTAKVLVYPNGRGGFEVEGVKRYIDEYADYPERRKGTARFSALASLVDHANRFKNEHSAFFADKSQMSLECVFDYHEKTHEGTPRFGEHRSKYNFPMSDELTLWKEHQGEFMSQTDFAEFLEERIVDVEVPPALDGDALDEATERLQKLRTILGGRFADPVQLMELSRGLKVTSEEKVHQVANLSSGEIQVQFTQEHRDSTGQPIKVANLFLINIPIFKDGDLYRIPVRLRYRLREGVIKWCYLMHGLDRSVNDAIEGACEHVENLTELPLFYGSPE